MMERTSRCSRLLRRGLAFSGSFAVIFGFSGCKQFILLSYLIFGPPSIEPEYNRQTGHEMTEFDVRVAVVCYAEDDLKWDFDKIDLQIAREVSYRMAAHKIKVIDPDLVRAWLDRNPEWVRPQEIAAGLDQDVTHVIYIDLLDYTLYAPHSQNLYRGRAEAKVTVFEMDETGEDGKSVFSKELKSQYPLLTTVSTGDVTYSTFRQRYLSRLSEEIGRLFYEYYSGDDIPDGA